MRCDSTITNGECPGVHHKFDSCRDEALHELMLDGGDGCGDGDFEGYGSHVPLPVGAVVSVPGLGTVQIEPGHYIVWTASTGRVSVSAYPATDEGASAAAKEYSEHAARYYLWDRGCDPNDRAGHADCAEYDECQRPGWAH